MKNINIDDYVNNALMPEIRYERLASSYRSRLKKIQDDFELPAEGDCNGAEQLKLSLLLTGVFYQSIGNPLMGETQFPFMQDVIYFCKKKTSDILTLLTANTEVCEDFTIIKEEKKAVKTEEDIKKEEEKLEILRKKNAAFIKERTEETKASKKKMAEFDEVWLQAITVKEPKSNKGKMKLFKKLLMSHFDLTKEQVDEINIQAAVIDNSVKNAFQFYREIERVRKLNKI